MLLISMPVPTFALTKVNVGVPDKVTWPSSPDTTPVSTAVPLTVAAVVPSYNLVTPVSPSIEIGLGVISPTS